MNTPAGSHETPSAIVVGAGIAGLTAAYRLQANGWRTRVLEASNVVGGRAQTVRRQGYVIDTGASAMTHAYGAYLALAEELGIADQVVEANSVVGIPRNGRLHEFDTSRVVRTGLTTSLFSWSAKLRMLKLLKDVQLARSRGQLNLNDMTRAAEIDDESARDYTLRELGEEIQDYLCDPLTRVMLIADSDEVSRVELFSAIANIFGTKMLALSGGVNAFSQALAAGLAVRFGATVTRVDDQAGQVTLHWRDNHGQTFSEAADACVVACPLPQALAVCPGHRGILEPLHDSLGYTACFNVAVGMTARPKTDAFAIPIPVPVSKDIALLFLDHHKAKDRTPADRYMISAHWENAVSQARINDPDEAIAEDTVRFLCELFPEIDGSIEMTHVARWPQALPLTRPGAYRAFREFGQRVDSRAKVQFAGDYLSAAGQNTAVVYGERAAANLMKRQPAGGPSR